MRIGLISDSHHAFDRLETALEKLLNEGIDLLLHAGDMGTEETLQKLAALAVPSYAVFGNNDYNLFALRERFNVEAEPWRVKHEGLRIKLMHRPLYFENDGADLTVFGHTHIPEAKLAGKTLVINPGEVCGRESGETHCAIAVLKEMGWRVTQYRADKNGWREETTEFIF